NEDICSAMNESLSKKWGELRGIKVVSVALNPITLSPEDAEMLKQAQYSARLQNPGLAGAELVGAQADAMRSAAANEGGAMNGFIGMGMAMNAGGGMNAQNFFNMQQQQNAQQAQTAPQADGWKCACGATATGKFCPECGAKKPEPQTANGWKCACGATATGKFCPECGAKKPEVQGWTCQCGTVAQGKFCPECGAKKPADAPLYKCDKCGWEPEDPKNPPKFCPECGDIFDDRDIT
ncbi:MAG: SPFH domain-containing protein, partial [Ruminococcus sp.]|nr:SPFH domain-containing protein [Ruminococcus sp.]